MMAPPGGFGGGGGGGAAPAVGRRTDRDVDLPDGRDSERGRRVILSRRRGARPRRAPASAGGQRERGAPP